MHVESLPYRDDDIDLEALVAYPTRDKHPTVILCHAWKGRDSFISDKAKLMSHWGYVGFALDMYGKGVIGQTKGEKAALKKPFIDDRALLLKRVQRGFQVACDLPYVDTDRVAVLGFGFGAVCALDLARSGAPLKGAISVYGHFDPPSYRLENPIRAKILVLHGYDDPVTSPSELTGFEREMTDQQVDWQVHLFGSTMHAFITPEANDPDAGILYNPLSAERSWSTIQLFLKEVFS